MKTKVLIIEDNFAKFFTTKQVLESQLKLEVQTHSVETGAELATVTAALSPDLVMVRPEGGITELLLKMKKRGTNRRNTEITILLTPDFDDGVLRQFEFMVSRRVANAA